MSDVDLRIPVALLRYWTRDGMAREDHVPRPEHLQAWAGPRYVPATDAQALLEEAYRLGFAAGAQAGAERSPL